MEMRPLGIFLHQATAMRMSCVHLGGPKKSLRLFNVFALFGVDARMFCRSVGDQKQPQDRPEYSQTTCNARQSSCNTRQSSASTRVLPDLAISNPAVVASGFGKNLFANHRTIRLMKLVASTMLSATKRDSTVQCFLCYVTVCEICGILYSASGQHYSSNCEDITSQLR